MPGSFKVMPYITRSVVVLMNATTIFIVIALLVTTNPKQSASVVFVEVFNVSGWDSLGVVFFLGMLPGLACLCALDTALHLTDEVKDARKQVPHVMLGSFGLGVFTGVAMIIILGFCNVDPQSLLGSVGGLPLVQIFLLNTYNSTPLLVVSTLLVIICFLMAAVMCVTSWVASILVVFESQAPSFPLVDISVFWVRPAPGKRHRCEHNSRRRSCGQHRQHNGDECHSWLCQSLHS